MTQDIISHLHLALKELTRETYRKIVRSGCIYKSRLNGRRSLCTAAPFPQNDAFFESEFAKIGGLIDEISTKRIHIVEELRGNFFIYFATESMIYHTSLF